MEKEEEENLHTWDMVQSLISELKLDIGVHLLQTPWCLETMGP